METVCSYAIRSIALEDMQILQAVKYIVFLKELQMADKYGKYIIKEPRMRPPHKEIVKPIVAFNRGRTDFPEVPFSINWEVIEVPFTMEKAGHTHDWDQLLCFIGSDPDDFFDFGAEIELYLGEESEKHIINSTSLVYIPRGFVHGPLIYTRVSKPILFNNIVLSSTYGRAKQY